MRRLTAACLILAAFVAACGETKVSVAGPSSPTGSTDATGATGAPVETGPTGASAATGPTAPEPCLEPGTVEVLSKANLFAAGIDELPHPAGGGGGTFPVCVILPSGVTTMRVIGVLGEVAYNPSGSPTSGPDGDASGSYAGGTIEAAGAVSGIVSTARVGFLAGVFLGDQPPSAPPGSLTFDDNYDFLELRPQLGQLFYIGDGTGIDGSLQGFAIPPGATRLFLGIADGFNFFGPPGFYDDNSGSFSLLVEFGSDVD